MNLSVRTDTATKAKAWLDENGLPHRRIEAWKYTDLKARLGEIWPPADPAVALPAVLPDELPFAGLEAYRFIFSNGRLQSSSDIPGVEISDHAATDEGWIARGDLSVIPALNAVYGGHGLSIELKPGLVLDKPLLVINIVDNAAPACVHTSHSLVLNEGAAATLIEAHLGVGEYIKTQIIDVRLAKSAKLSHIKLQDDGSRAKHLSQMRVNLGAHSEMISRTLITGAALSRQEILPLFTGEGGRGDFRTAMLLSNDQHADMTVQVDHAVPGCRSSQHVKSVLTDKARGVYQGKVLVRPDAQKTDGRQMSESLLLSDNARMDVKPELEIRADDVQCAHGATTGGVDEEMLFYLMSRGIPRPGALRLLVMAFIAEVLQQPGDQPNDQPGDDPISAELTRHAGRWLDRQEGAS